MPARCGIQGRSLVRLTAPQDRYGKEKAMASVRCWMLGAALFFGVGLFSGCGGGGAPAKPAKPAAKPGDTAAKPAQALDVDWCDEHGVPEAICARCNPKLAEEFKKNGDWCNEHGAPKSQCFACDPKLKEKFEALKPKPAETKK